MNVAVYGLNHRIRDFHVKSRMRWFMRVPQSFAAVYAFKEFLAAIRF